MNRITFGIAAAAAFGVIAMQDVRAADATLGYAFVGGSGENESVAYAGQAPQGSRLDPATVTGSGENVSVVLPPPAPAAPVQYQAVIDGTGENQSVRYVPVAPRG